MSEPLIRDAGTPESVWMPWLASRSIHSVSLDALCPAPSRLVVLAPHPDDEILACGGLLSMQVAAGGECMVVAISDGEASHGTHDLAVSRCLGERRVQESRKGLQVLGLRLPPVVRLGIPDGGVGAAVEIIAAKLSLRLKPSDRLMVTWSHDGHPDHEAAAKAAMRAAQAVGCRLLQAPVWMWHWAQPDDTRVPWHRMVAVKLTGQARQAKQAALNCHESQLEDRSTGQGPVLVPSIVARAARPFEYFFA
ncbi:MAG: PIG-L family deacetylase [Polaromonas sp.]|nr:PIG-L family deacetylase [Polaromonas sp.]